MGGPGWVIGAQPEQGREEEQEQDRPKQAGAPALLQPGPGRPDAQRLLRIELLPGFLNLQHIPGKLKPLAYGRASLLWQSSAQRRTGSRPTSTPRLPSARRTVHCFPDDPEDLGRNISWSGLAGTLPAAGNR